jgi:hypothetical protein
MDPDEYDNSIAPFQRAAQLQQEVRTTKQLGEIANKMAQAEAAEKEMPQCPFCGGRIPRGFVKCKNCASDLIWFHGFPGKPGSEESLRKNVIKIEQKQAVQQRFIAEKTAKQEKAKEEKYHTMGVVFSVIVWTLLITLIIVIIKFFFWLYDV